MIEVFLLVVCYFGLFVFVLRDLVFVFCLFCFQLKFFILVTVAYLCTTVSVGAS